MPIGKRGPQRRNSGSGTGFDSMLRGIGDLIDLVSTMLERGEQEASQSGEFSVGGTDDRLRGVYGVSVRTGIGGIPRVERFGNIRSSDQGPIVAEVREPLFDLFDETAEIVIVVELPGVAEDEINIVIDGNLLAVTTSGERKFARDMSLPTTVDPNSLQKIYRNGILELRLAKSLRKA